MIRDPVRCVAILFAAAMMSTGWAACVHEPVLKPASSAQSVAGKQNTAFADVAGVRVLVAGDAWKGRRSSPADQLTPIQVTVENHSGRALRIRYQDLSLHGGTGASYAPLALARENAYRFGSLMRTAAYQPMAVYVPVTARCDKQEGLVDAPYLAYSYPGPSPFRSSVFAYGEGDPSCAQAVPTGEMLAEALPEGSVQDGARAAGFLYFEGVGNRESTVQLGMNLVDANSGQPFGQVSIPLAVSK
jgi:hypothetical protein